MSVLPIWYVPVPCWACQNNNLTSNSNISKTIRINTAFMATFFKEYLISFLMIARLIDFALVVFKSLMFKVCGVTEISIIEFFRFSGTERVS